MKIEILEKTGYFGLRVTLKPRFYLSQKLVKWDAQRAFDHLRAQNCDIMNSTEDRAVITNSSQIND